MPTDSRPQGIDGLAASWLRLRYIQKPGQGYTSSPRIRGLRLDRIGGTVAARQAQSTVQEYLGESDGTPDQVFALREHPVLRSAEPHVIESTLDGEMQEWTEVEDFSQSSPGDHHFKLSYATGDVRFGPSVRDREGMSRQYGAVPHRGSELRLRSYYSGGGVVGNVGEGSISQLKTLIPYIAGVINYRASRGGREEESLEETRLRSLDVLKRPAAAITREDFERIALEARGVGRAHAIAPGAAGGSATPGTIRLLLVPDLTEAAAELTPEDLAPTPLLIEQVSERLDERKTLGTLIQYEAAPFTWVELDAHIFVRPGSDVDETQARAVNLLREYLHPTRGGPSKRGLGFGGAATVSQIAGILQSLPGVVYVERVRLRAPGSQNEVTRLQAEADGLLALGRCYVLAEIADA